MRVRTIGTKSHGTARRGLALVTLALFGHAVALHLLHGHSVASGARSHAVAAVVSTPHDVPAGETHSHDDCPACQLQHGFAFLGAAPAVLWPDGGAPIGLGLAEVAATHRLAERSAPSRAPPTL